MKGLYEVYEKYLNESRIRIRSINNLCNGWMKSSH